MHEETLGPSTPLKVFKWKPFIGKGYCLPREDKVWMQWSLLNSYFVLASMGWAIVIATWSISQASSIKIFNLNVNDLDVYHRDFCWAFLICLYFIIQGSYV